VGEKGGEEVDVFGNAHCILGGLHGKAVSQWSFCSIAVSTDNLAFGRASDCVRLGLVVSHRRNKRVGFIGSSPRLQYYSEGDCLVYEPI
jgi:hypothetical protein